MHSDIHSLSASEPPANNASSDTLAFSLRLVPFQPAADAPLTRTGSSAALLSALLPSHGPISSTLEEEVLKSL
jgi:hypothetical protein